MRSWSLNSQRRLIGTAALVTAAAGIYWAFFSEGFPILWGPSASAEEIAEGRELFEHVWEPHDPLAHGDGLGPVFNARSCAACHFQGGLGGGGGLEHNAVAFEVLPRPDDRTFHNGGLHQFSVDPAFQESLELLKRLYPAVANRTVSASGECGPVTRTVAGFNPVRTESLQATALFGAGWIDLISDKAIAYNRRKRLAQGIVKEMNLEFDGVAVGKLRTLPDGRVGRFGWRAQSASLQDFVGTACANEIGLGTPDVEQASPLGAPGLKSAPDLDKKQFRALVAFVKTLPRPVEIPPEDAAQRLAAAHGKEIFKSVGCAACHIPDLGGVSGIYSDFLLYTLDDPAPTPGPGIYGDQPPEPRPDDAPNPSEWKTPPLWGVADSAPYFHDGMSPTLQDAIVRHRGDARAVSEAYAQLSAEDKQALVTFLGTLRAPPNATPLRDPSVTELANK
jgi:CxxC motif-containing protein (DUF1111 family)